MLSGNSLLKNSICPMILNASANPMTISCGASHMTVMGATPSAPPCDTAAARRFLSTTADTIMPMMEMTSPIPILWSIVIPPSILVRFRINGTRRRSYNGIHIAMGKLFPHGGCDRRIVIPTGFIWELNFPFVERRYAHVSNAGEDAPLRLHVNVNAHAEEEQHDGEDHESRGDAEPQRPAHGVLNIDHDCQREDEHHRQRSVVPVEETADPLPAFLRRGVELVHAERDTAWPDSAAADGEEAQSQEEITHL
nr:Os04g0464300 [Ipomoea trifida]